MPIIRYQVSKLCEKNKEKILKAAKLDDIGEWDYQRVREYLAGTQNRPGFIKVYHDWDELGEVGDPRTGKQVEFDFKPREVPLNRKDPGKGCRAMNLNQKTANWLVLGIQFNHQAIKRLNSVKGLPQITGPPMPGSVSEFITALLNDEARNVLVQSDIAEIGREKS